MNAAMNDPVTLRDVVTFVRRSAGLVIGVPVVTGAVALAVCLLSQKVYTSEAAVSLSVSSQAVANQLVTAQLLANLPSAAGLAQGFTQQIGTRAFAGAVDTPRPDQWYGARFEERKGLLTLTAKGTSPAEARARAVRLLDVAQNYLRDRVAVAATANLTSALAQTTLDLRAAEGSLQEVQSLLKTVAQGAGTAPPAVAAALEAQKIDPQAARSAYPAWAFLTIQEAGLKAQLAQARVRAQILDGVLKDPALLSRLVGQALQVQVLAPPAEPLRQSQPRPALYTGFASLVGLMAGVFAAFLRDAFRAGA